MLSFSDQLKKNHVIVHIVIQEVCGQFKVVIFSHNQEVNSIINFEPEIKRRNRFKKRNEKLLFDSSETALKHALNAKKELEVKKFRLHVNNKIITYDVLVVIE